MKPSDWIQHIRFLKEHHPDTPKVCNACGKKKTVMDFYSSATRRHQCKSCRSLVESKRRQTEGFKDWKHRYRKALYWKDPGKAREKQRVYSRAFYDRHKADPSFIKKEAKRIVAWRKKRVADGYINGLIAGRMRVRLANSLSRRGVRKNINTFDLVGCDIETLVAHLESKFLPGMSWSRRDEIHIDHIRPCASFDLTDAKQQRECFHYTNLQPLWKKDNLSKGAKIIA